MKIQSFYIYRFTSGRIIRHDYQIELDIQEARRNGEIVSIAENQAFRSLFKLQGREYHPEEIEELFEEKRKIKNRRSSPENIARLIEIEKRINDILFIPEICSVVCKNKKEYFKIIKHSFYVNGQRMARFMCGAGHSRRNTVIFCSERIEKQLKRILNNGRNEDVEISPNKYNAYLALSLSGTLPVSEPYFTVIPDLEVTRDERVDFVVEDSGDPHIEERVMPIEFNVFDGQGLISIQQAKKWAKEIGLDYIPSTFIVRNAFLKGMLVTMDFHLYSEMIGKHITKDMYGHDVNVRDMDLILTKSMFKGNVFYNSIDEYIHKCRNNGFLWGISRFGPEKDYDHVFSNYQFIQNLDLDDNKIKQICQKTVDYLEKTAGKDIGYTLLYLLGKNAYSEPDVKLLDRINDPVTKALLLNNNLIQDRFIQNHIVHSLNKKIKESYVSNLLLDGNYSAMVVDPMALMEHMFGLPIKGLLNRGEHYSNYWLKKDVTEAAAMRAPLTFRSEVNKLHFKSNEDTNFWYQYITSGIIYNIFGIDTLLQADSDWDGDLTMTTNDPVILSSIYSGLPISYNKGSAYKKKIKEDELYLVDGKTFNSPIGIITNSSTTMIGNLSEYKKGSKEYKELLERLKLCRFYQGQAIDAAKNTNAKSMPGYWFRWTKVKEDFTVGQIEKAELNNKLIIDKRPYFMRHMYTYLNRRYIKYNKKYDNHCTTMFRKNLSDLLSASSDDLTQKEKDLLDKYYRYNPLLLSDCISNKICRYLEEKIKEIKYENKDSNIKEITSILIDKSIVFDKYKYLDLFVLYERYKKEKRNFACLRDMNGEEMFRTLEQYNKHIRDEAFKISGDIQELANLSIEICYFARPHDNKQFAWQIFGDGIVKNIIGNKQEKSFAPFLDTNGSIEFQGNRFSMFEIDNNFEKEIEDYGTYF